MDLDDVFAFSAPISIKIKDRYLGLMHYIALAVGVCLGLFYSLGYKCSHLKEVPVDKFILKKKFVMKQNPELRARGVDLNDMKEITSSVEGRVLVPNFIRYDTFSLDEQGQWNLTERTQIPNYCPNTTLEISMDLVTQMPLADVLAAGPSNKGKAGVWKYGRPDQGEIFAGKETTELRKLSAGELSANRFTVRDLFKAAGFDGELCAARFDKPHGSLTLEISNKQNFDVFGHAPPFYKLTVQPNKLKGLLQDPCMYMHNVRLGEGTKHRTQAYGVCFELEVVGSLRKFDPLGLMNAIVAYSFLVGVTQTLIIMAARFLMPDRQKYKALLIQESVAFHPTPSNEPSATA